MDFEFLLNGEVVSVKLAPEGAGYRAAVGGRDFAVAAIRAQPGEIDFKLG